MKPISLISPIFATILAISASSPVFAHVGHGDEFQSKGGIQRVQVNTATDQQFGFVVTPIAQSATGVMIPITALVEADGKQLVFVQYANFYEPVPVTTGKTQGERIEITQGLSAGEKLVTQGSLSLYAQSRKTQKPESVANATASPNAIATPKTTNPNIVATTTSPTTDDNQGSRLLVGGVVVGGSLLAMLGGAIYFFKNRKSSRPKKRDFSANDRGDV
jgi:cation efflux system membrane fusion protein